MEKPVKILVLFVVLGFNFVFAQPYTLDKKIKPLKLVIKEHANYDTGKFGEENYVLRTGDTNYHYVEGHDLFEFVDIYIYAHNGNPAIQADLVFNTWTNIEETQHTAKSKNGIINFKVRSHQDIGFKIRSGENSNIDYGIVVRASEPIMEYLGSPFVSASNAQTQASNTNTPGWWLYLIIGLLVLLVGFLVGRLLNSKKKATLLFLVLGFICTLQMRAQEESLRRQENQIRESELNTENYEYNQARRQQIDNMIDLANANISSIQSTNEAIQNLYQQYRNLGSCLRSASPSGQPSIPSFCGDQRNDCAECFGRARANFNRWRYNLEKLQTIYDCTMSYTDAAIAFGDNASGVHGVVGLVWQFEKNKILKSRIGLQEAYDKKRLEMLQSFNESLMEISRCEEQHGIADWYDRFGKLYYDFAEFTYRR